MASLLLRNARLLSQTKREGTGQYADTFTAEFREKGEQYSTFVQSEVEIDPKAVDTVLDVDYSGVILRSIKSAKGNFSFLSAQNVMARPAGKAG